MKNVGLIFIFCLAISMSGYNIQVVNYQLGDVTLNRISLQPNLEHTPWVVGDNGQVLKLRGNGYIDRRFTLDSSYNLTGISFRPSDGGRCGYIVGYKRNEPDKWKGTIWKTENWGETWILLTSPNIINGLPIPYLNVAAGANGVVWVSCGHGYVIKSITGGASWLIVTKPVRESHTGWFWGLDIDYYNPDIAWVCGDQSRIFANTTDGGQSWQVYEPFTEDSLVYNDIDYESLGYTLLSAASKGRLVSYWTNNPNSWTQNYPFGSAQTSQWFYGAYKEIGLAWGVGSGGMMGATWSSGEKHWYSQKYDLRDITGELTLGEYVRMYAVGTNATIIYISGADNYQEPSIADTVNNFEWSITTQDRPNDHGWHVIITWPGYPNANQYKIYCRPAPNTNLGGTSGYGE